MAQTRRALLGGAAIVAAAGVAMPALAAGNPDAALIAACDDYIRALDTYNRDTSDVDCDEDPLWHALEAAEERAADIPAETMAGLVAKARAAAATGRLPNGSVKLSESYAGHWPAELVRDVLRLAGDEVPA